MDKLEKVIKGLDCCSKGDSADCDNCNYHGVMTDVPCESTLMRDALALLKAQEPRVMAWDEVRAAMKAPIWKETKSMNNALYQGWVLAYDIQTGQGITGTRLGMAEPSGRVVWYKVEDYGKTWRCWTARPDDAQREATHWNA